MTIIEIDKFYDKTAKISEIDVYIKKALELVKEGEDVILTGQGPIWLYLKIAHALHGRARKLIYRSPVTGDVLIFDHNPF